MEGVDLIKKCSAAGLIFNTYFVRGLVNGHEYLSR